MKSKLFSSKSIALFCVSMLFVLSGFAQAKNQVAPCDEIKVVTSVKGDNADGKTNATATGTQSSSDDAQTPTVIVKSTNVANSGKNNQYAKITVEGNSFDTKEVEVKDADSPRYITSPKPEYIYGKRALAEHIVKTAKYPTDAKKDKAKGIVIVQVIVEKDGSFSNPQVISPVHPLLDAEALRVVGTLKCFIPGKADKEPVRSFYQIPIAFEYKDK